MRQATSFLKAFESIQHGFTDKRAFGGELKKHHWAESSNLGGSSHISFGFTLLRIDSTSKAMGGTTAMLSGGLLRKILSSAPL